MSKGRHSGAEGKAEKPAPPGDTRARRNTRCGRETPASAVDFAAMPDSHHEHHERGILNLVHDPVIPDPDPVKLALALQLHASRRARLVFKPAQCVHDPALQRVIPQPFEKLRRRGRDNDAVAHSRSRLSNSSSVIASPVFSYSASDSWAAARSSASSRASSSARSSINSTTRLARSSERAASLE